MILVAGIGNIFLGDDGFGSEVAQRLAARGPLKDVRVVDFGIRGLDLAYSLLDPYDAVILVDAASRGGAPGTLYVIDPELQDSSTVSINTHEIHPASVLAIARQMGAVFHKVRIVGCEPETFGWPEEGIMGLSESVNAAADKAIPIIDSLIQETRNELEKEAVNKQVRDRCAAVGPGRRRSA